MLTSQRNETSMKTTKTLFTIPNLTFGLASILLCGCGESEEQLQKQITVQGKMPTAEESVKWAIWEARTKYVSFDIVSTNVTELAEKQTYRGEKQGGAAEVAEEKRQFGASYDAWSTGDSFARLETNYLCNLVVTHAKAKRESEASMLVTAEMEEGTPGTNPYFSSNGGPDTNHLRTVAYLLNLQNYADYKVLREEVYRVNRNVGGRLMKPVNTANGLAYVWDTEERNKTYVRPTWVLIEEVGNLKPK